MAKQQSYQKFILKVESSRILLSKNKDLHITLAEARKNKEIISLSDSEVLRMIDSINELDRQQVEREITKLRKELSFLKRQTKTLSNKKKISFIYNRLDELQFKPEYVAVIMSKLSDFAKLNAGFKINGIPYHRLVGTTNGVKKNTIVYCAETSSNNKPMFAELSRRLDNDRDLTQKVIPGKYEAYKSLACSSSSPVSTPKGVLVVDDLITHFKDNIIKLSGTHDAEPVMEELYTEVELNCSDGYGLMSPRLAAEWSKVLHIEYIIGGGCLRNSFCKGMTVTFDFHEFARRVHCTKVKDVWGQEHNIEDIDLILTTSMLKLWNCYSSIDHYLECCKKNGYSFSITKVCPATLENERTLNYQFIQSYNLSDEDIGELIQPTISEIKDILDGDINKTILFLKGSNIDTEKVASYENDIAKALMIEPRLMNDPYIIGRINMMIKKKINEAKIGVLKVHGNYATVVGDPYALCQHIFNVQVEDHQYGLLQAGEMYSKYWVDNNTPQVVCFRAPMSCHNNIRAMNIKNDDEMSFWYQYMPTINIINCHDTLCHAENGCDFDGDALITTDNPVLLKNTIPLPAILCEQNSAQKVIITEDTLIQANKNGFGDSIGKITNKVTTMYDVQAQFPPDSLEYKTLDYRIKCGQLYQQEAIDKVKGIVAKTMPKEWFDRLANKILPTDTEEDIKRKNFNLSILADRKPYFMMYIYPTLMSEYKQYISNTNKKSIMEFNMTIDELIDKPNKTKREKEFLKWYYTKFPVGMNSCVMNKICWRVEKEFKHYISELKQKEAFDYTILKSGIEYSPSTYKAIGTLYTEYNNEMKKYYEEAKLQRKDKDDINIQKTYYTNQFKRKCLEICNNEKELCEVMLDLCYTSEKSKKFVWDICSNVIIENLLENKMYQIVCIVRDVDGDITYCGERFKKIIRDLKQKSGV